MSRPTADEVGRHSPDRTPTAKMTVSGLTGLSVAGVIGELDKYGITISPGLAGLVVMLAGFAAGYVKKSRPSEEDH